MHAEALNLREVLVFLAAAGLVVPLFRRIRVSPVLGYLVVGLVIGPFGLARFTGDYPLLAHVVISDLEGVRALAELGVIFLLFMIGLELSLDRLWGMRRLVFGLGGLQIVLTGTIIAAIASAFDNSLPAAIVLGAGFALSSTAIVMQLLGENRRLGTPAGRTAFAILLCQDLAVLPILFLVGALAAKGGQSPAIAFALAAGQAISAVVLILIAGRLILRPLFRFAGSAASREMFLALVLLIIVGTALLTEMAGLSMALGAFLAGLLFAETEYRHAIEVDIEPFKGLLLGLFFVSVGMSIDLTQVAANPFWLAASVVGLFLVKGPIIFALTRLFGEPRSVAAEVALLLGQSGEFAFLVVGMAFSLGLMPQETAQFMLIVTGLTMTVTPVVAYFARSLAAGMEATAARDVEPGENVAANLTGHVIIVGYGRVGQLLGSVLDTQELPHIGIDIDANLVARFRSVGAGIYFGDASQPEILHRFSPGEAAALVVTMDNPLPAEAIIRAARKHWPDLSIYARARDIAHARHLVDCGANHAIPETMEASLQLGEMVLIGAGLPISAARHLIDIRRQNDQAALDEKTE